MADVRSLPPGCISIYGSTWVLLTRSASCDWTGEWHSHRHTIQSVVAFRDCVRQGAVDGWRRRANCRCTQSESGEESSDAGTLMSVGMRILDSVYATVVANSSGVQDSGVTGGL